MVLESLARLQWILGSTQCLCNQLLEDFLGVAELDIIERSSLVPKLIDYFLVLCVKLWSLFSGVSEDIWCVIHTGNQIAINWFDWIVYFSQIMEILDDFCLIRSETPKWHICIFAVIKQIKSWFTLLKDSWSLREKIWDLGWTQIMWIRLVRFHHRLLELNPSRVVFLIHVQNPLASSKKFLKLWACIFVIFVPWWFLF